MKLIRTKNYEEMSLRAAALLASQIIRKPDSVLGLATGATPLGMYGFLVDWYRKGVLDFRDVQTWNLDEYLGVQKVDSHSYYYFMHKNLFDGINIPEESIHMLDGMAEDIGHECAAYDEGIRKAGGIDLQVLGLGHDGHIAFNEPEKFFSAGTHCVAINKSTIRANARFSLKEEEVPKKAMTMGIGNIMAAGKILLLVCGADKAEILQRVLQGPVAPEIPGSILQFHQNVTVVATEDALREME